MKTKIFLLSTVATMGGVLAMMIGQYATAGSIDFSDIAPDDPIRNSFTQVHFTFPHTDPNNGGNDSQGSFLWLPAKELPSGSPETITYPGGTPSSKTCRKQIRGLYYSAARGERLRPLDQQTLNGLRSVDASYDNLSIDGGFYTTCGLSGSIDLVSIYGQIEFTYSAVPPTEISSLTAGVQYNPNVSPGGAIDYSRPGLFPTLQYFNNQTPVGYLFDSFVGIGFLGGKLDVDVHQQVLDEIDDTQGIDDTFGLQGSGTIVAKVPICTVDPDRCKIEEGSLLAGIDTLWNVSILGNILLSRGGLDATNRQAVLGNPSQTSAIVFSDIVNTSDILNALRKNANALCAGRQKYNGNGAIESAIASANKVVCGVNDNGGTSYLGIGTDDPVVIDLDTNSYDGKEIIIQGRDVILQGSMPYTTSRLNLFVDNGNVFLQGGGDDFWQFNSTGNPISLYTVPAGPTSINTGYQYGKFIRGNIFVNGLIMGGAPTSPSQIGEKYYIHGRIASLNTALEPSTPRTALITSMFGGFTPYINFNQIFTWGCGVDGWSSLTVNGNKLPCQVPNDNFKNSALVLIKTPIATSLYQ